MCFAVAVFVCNTTTLFKYEMRLIDNGLLNKEINCKFYRPVYDALEYIGHSKVLNSSIGWKLLSNIVRSMIHNND